MYHFFNIITAMVDVLLYPFSTLPPFWGIAFLALLTAVFILLIYKAVSNQEAIKSLKKRIMGHFLGVYLFRDDAGQILTTQVKLLGSIMRYLGHSFRPLLVIIVPILLVCVQMQLRYGYENPRPGDELNVFLKLNPETDILSSRIKLETSPGISVAAPDLRINKLNEIDWRIGVGGEGDFQIRFDINGEAIKRPLSTSREIERIYPVTERASFLGILKYPGEELLDKTGPVLSLRIDYPPRSINLFGLRLHWIIVYFFLAMVFGLLLKRLLKVDF